MINQKQLTEFLVKAKKATYASGDEKLERKEDDKSKTLVFEEGDWKYHDNYFGGDPFGGREVVFFKNQPVYMMVYYGRMDDSVPDIHAVSKVIKGALSLITADAPFRGPKRHEVDDLLYTNDWTGDVSNFSGEESITENNKEIYQAKYSGGLVDQRKE